MNKLTNNNLLRDVFKKHRNDLDEWKEGREELLEKDTAIIPSDDLENFLDYIVKKIEDFGYGETYFHTADIELMINIINKLSEEINSEKAGKTCATKHIIPPKSKDWGILPNFT